MHATNIEVKDAGKNSDRKGDKARAADKSADTKSADSKAAKK
jgi:hypothetical protein